MRGSRIAPALLCAVLLGGCAAVGEPSGGTPSSAPAALDNCGTRISVPKPPSRVVTLDQAATEVMLALGLQERMVGTAHLDDEILPEYAQTYQQIPVLASEYPTPEQLAAADPDFVYASHVSAFAAGKRDAASYVSPADCSPVPLTVDAVLAEITEIGAIFGVPERAAALVADHRARITAAAASVDQVERERLMWWDDGTATPAVGACCGVPAAMMAAIGAPNVSATVPGTSTESAWATVAATDPTVIVLIEPADEKKAYLAGDATLKELTAVLHERYVTLPRQESTAGVRTVLGIEHLAAGLTALGVGVSS
ncbi:ABC transporter substrate-binding protein [Catenuloplanes japonicus]|uniref:ABC transporter substrate-binding protein n=1 Tax=Catenuloplanes japonicus TaxID=33876 RepID=UPI000526E7E1|nr:ABC transporter substrate-binding protein [Catenuloplanes japonicus]